MNGTVTARVVRGRARQADVQVSQTAADKPGFFERPNGVLGLVLASTVMTSACGYVVYSNALDAQRAAVEQVADRAPEPQSGPGTAVPMTELFDTTVSVAIDNGPATRTAPALAEIENPASDTPSTAGGLLYSVVEGRPPVEPRPRPSLGPDLVTLAQNITPARALSFPHPTQRPEIATGAEPPEDVVDGTLRLAEASPRPSIRPEDLVTRVAASPADLEIEIARGEVGEIPRGSLFGGSAGECNSRLTRQMPRRPGSAAGGSAVMAAVGNGSGSNRDNRLVQEALNGNMPDYMRNLHPVTFESTVGGRSVTVTICVTPDYLAIGSDSDHVRVPLGLPAALRVADAFDMMLPTTSMVDAIYQQADVRIAPSPMTPGSAMSSTGYFVTHDETVDAQFARAGAQQGMLVAGHKKDLVIANRLSRNPGRVAIYGWHRTNGQAIQPLSTVHGEYYADYSHGIRLVSRTAYVNGEAVDLRQLLTDERYAGFLNSDGALTGATIRLASL